MNKMTLQNLEDLRRELANRIILDLEGKTKEDIFLGIAKFAKEKGLVKDDMDLYNKFIEQDMMYSSFVDLIREIACPEVRMPAMSKPFAFILCRTKNLIDFKLAEESHPVKIIIASLYRNRTDLTKALRPMARTSGIFREEIYKEAFLKANNTDNFFELLEKIIKQTSMERKFIKCTPVTFGFGHSDPGSKYNRFKDRIKEDLKGLDFSRLDKVYLYFVIHIAKDREKFGNDLDNFAKPVVDALNEAGIIKDESQIFSIYMNKVIVDNKDKEGITIQIR